MKPREYIFNEAETFSRDSNFTADTPEKQLLLKILEQAWLDAVNLEFFLEERKKGNKAVFTTGNEYTSLHSIRASLLNFINGRYEFSLYYIVQHIAGKNITYRSIRQRFLEVMNKNNGMRLLKKPYTNSGNNKKSKNSMGVSRPCEILQLNF